MERRLVACLWLLMLGVREVCLEPWAEWHLCMLVRRSFSLYWDLCNSALIDYLSMYSCARFIFLGTIFFKPGAAVVLSWTWSARDGWRSEEHIFLTEDVQHQLLSDCYVIVINISRFGLFNKHLTLSRVQRSQYKYHRYLSLSMSLSAISGYLELSELMLDGLEQ